MRKVWCGVAVWIFVCTSVAWARNDADVENAFRSSVVKKQFVLRNFSGEDKVHAEWRPTEVVLDPPRWHTMGVVEVTSVKMKGQTLIMNCFRRVVVKADSSRISLYAVATPIEIDVELKGADPTDVLPRLKDALFYGSISDAMASLPKHGSDFVSMPMDFNSVKRPDPSKPPCDCAADDRTACAADHRKIDGMVPPVFLKGKTPEITDQARRGSPDARVEVALDVDTAGHPQDVWVIRPAGPGLDEEAAKAVLTYVFRPATCHNNPVSVHLTVDMPFQR